MLFLPNKKILKLGDVTNEVVFNKSCHETDAIR